MLDGTEFYVVVKLTSGEQMLAVLKNEDDDYVEIESPMVIRTIPNLSEGREHVTAHPFCQFSDENNFTLHKANILFVKKLHHAFIPHYLRIVSESERTSLVTQEDDWEGEVMSVEEARRRIEMLRSIAGLDEEEETPSPKSVFVEGNDTIN
jgi:hypothetical protein